MTAPIRVTVWNEFWHENPQRHADVKSRLEKYGFSGERVRNATEGVHKVYPDGMHTVIANHLREQGFVVRTATLDEAEHGLTEDVLAETDVLTWWGHAAHDQVSDEIVDRVHERVNMGGMGLIALHSAHYSKIFQKLMGTSCMLKTREADEKERIWVIEQGHPIARGLPEYFEIPQTEMYGEPFDVPAPDTLIFVSWFQGGEIFRSGCCYHRGRGKVFYFRPGHETLPVYYQPEVLQVISNAVRWAAPAGGPELTFGDHPPLEKLD